MKSLLWWHWVVAFIGYVALPVLVGWHQGIAKTQENAWTFNSTVFLWVTLMLMIGFMAKYFFGR